MKNFPKEIEEEAKFWDQKALEETAIPDIRKQIRSNKINFIWDDPKIEDIMRNKERKFIIERASKNRGGKVLEIGCGIGWLSLELARVGMNVIGCDISSRKIAIAQGYFSKIKKEENIEGDINYLVSPIQKVTFDKSTFDAIVAWDSLHHMPNIESVIKNAASWLRPEGELIIYEHIGANFLNKIIIMMIYTLPIVDKKRIFQKIKRRISMRKFAQKAPCEGITKLEMLRAIRKFFDVAEFKTTLALSYYIAPFLSLNEYSRYKFIKFLKRLDDLLIKLNFLRGEYIFVWARKKKAK